ncbi:MAG: L-cystine transporter [Fusobacteriaceae bacterium]
MAALVVLNIIIFLGLIYALYYMQKKFISFSKRVFIALIISIVFGAYFQLVYSEDSVVIKDSIMYINIIGSGYVRLLKMIVMPLVMVSITSAIINLKDNKSLGKMSGLIIGVLIGTAIIASLIGIFVALGFGLSAEGLIAGADETQRATFLLKTAETVSTESFITKFVEMIPSNPFLDMTGARDSSIISVVIFSAFVAISALGIAKKKPEAFETFKNIVNTLHDIVLRIVTLVLRLTPYGILALMTKVIATSHVEQIVKLGAFTVATYVALIIMFGIHLLILFIAGLNPLIYLKKSFPVLTFAFTSRTSAGTIPMTVRAQNKQMGVSEGISNLSATLGASIGQNGCAAIYPAMLVVMLAPMKNINPLDPSFLIPLIIIIAISSFGVAGVGGGATFAGILVLSAIGFPIELVGLLIAVEPLIDMGRTALNVSDSMLSGLITAKKLKQIDMEIYNSEISIEKDSQ